MKKLSKFAIVTLIIFLLILAASGFAVKPIYNRLAGAVDAMTSKVCKIITDNTGLYLTYDSFSPSILSSFKLKKIALKDEEGNEIAGIKKIRVNYRLKELFAGNYEEFVRSVSVDGVVFDITKALEVINNFEFPQDENKESTVDINQIISFIPADISIKNVHAFYDDKSVRAEAMVKNLNVTNSKRKQCIEFQLKSNASAFLKDARMNISGNLGCSGTIYDGIEGSTLNLKLTEWTNGTYKLNRINLLATYKDNKLEAHTIQAVNPFYANGEIDFNTMDITCGIKTENLNVLSMVQDISGKNSLSFLKNIRPTITADAHFNPNTMELTYTSGGKIFVGDKLFPGSVNVGYNLSGNDKRIKVKSLYAKGPNCDLYSNLDFTFATLQLGGQINLEQYTLPNGKQISTEVFIEPLPKGFTLFTPQVSAGEKSLTALQAKIIPEKDSIDFEMEVSDYSFADSGVPGVVKIDGSYLTTSNYAQISVSMVSLSVGSIMEIVQQLVPQDIAENVDGVKNFSKPYLFSGDVYVSSDLKSVSYNVPYLIVANIENENQYLFASANGNEQSVQINRFDLIFGKYALGLEASFDINPDTHDGYFMVDLLFSQIPYHVAGTIMQDRINVTGDYGINAEVRLGKKNNVAGELYIDNLPIVFEQFSYLLSMDSFFEYDPEKGPDVKVSRMEIKENKKGLAEEPKLLLTGSGTKYGATIDSISYTDSISAMYGYASLTYNFNKEIFNNAELSVFLKNQLSEEQITLNALVSNPNGVEFSSADILDSLYVNTNIDIHHLSLNRYLTVQNDDNEVTASISVTGTVAHPYALIDITKASMLFGNDVIQASGAFFLEDRILSVDRLKVRYAGMNIDNFGGSLAVDKIDGKFTAVVSTVGQVSQLIMPISINIYDAYIPEGRFLPESFMVTLSSEQISGELIKKKVGFDITAAYSKDIISLFSSDNLGLVGTFIPSTGELFGSVNSEDIMSLNLEGKIKQNSVNIKMSNININLGHMLSYFRLDEYMTVESGILKGSLVLGGSFDSPEFRGALSVTSPKVYLPTVLPDALYTDKLLIAAANNEITLREDTYYIKKQPCFTFAAKIILDKWIVDSIEAKLTTIKGEYIPLKLKTDFVNVSGEIAGNIIMTYSDFTWDIGGNLFGEKVNIVSNLSDVTGAAKNMSNNEASNPKMQPRNQTYIRTDINVVLGTHVMLNFNPLLRCVFAPDTKIGLRIDTLSEDYQIVGALNIKTGDVSYLNRNFYIKEGNIKFNSSDLTNPIVNLRAETRERDDSGKNVTIILSAENQYLQDLSPKFSAIPAKSEMEILSILGSIVTADADKVSDILISSADYAFQSTVVRGIENKLRDVMNFDIFSIRTNVIQNTLNMGTSGELSKEDLTIGNFLDNSTVYIGKYLGSSLYVDAMFNFSLENGNVVDPTKANGLLFQPEFGLELELPIANIRWNMAPDLKALMAGQYVPSNSLSLSWNFQF